MFDVLVYLYENYYRPEACPDTDTLARKLTAAGFEGEEISDALSWLNGLALVTQTTIPVAYSNNTSFRVYADVEYERLGADSIGFLSFLDSAGVLNPLLREIVIERALATDETPVRPDKLKIIVLMVLWSQGEEPDSLILDELIEDDEPRLLH
jgi:Smg protein